MRIIFASSSFKGGGITSYALEVIKQYSADNDFYVLIGDDSQSPLDGYGIKKIHCDADDVSVQNALYIIKEINEVIKPDVIINSNSKIISLVTPFVSDQIKVVSVSHSLRYLETDAAAIANNYTDNIIALSYAGKKYIDRRFHIHDPQKTRVVYNFVSDIENREESLQNKKSANLIKIVYMGGGSGSKTPDLVYGILKCLLATNYKFKFYWLGHDTAPLQTIQPIKKVKELLPQDERVEVTGRLPREQAMEISSKANVILIPSRREGCPIALLEAMRYGVIAVTGDYKNACSELIKDGYNGFVLPHTKTRAFVERICDIIDNHPQYLDLYDNSLTMFDNQTSYKVWSDRMNQIIYDKTLTHKKRFSEFSVIKYRLLLYKLKFLNIFNFFHEVFYEMIPAAWPFFKDGIRKNIFTNKRKYKQINSIIMRTAIINFLNKFYLYKILAAYVQKRIVMKNPAREMTRTYWNTYHEKPNLEKPTNLIEKIYWMLLHADTSLWTLCADKYRVREYVREKGLENYLPQLYAMWETADQIDFSKLPDSFILKTNNACGQCKIVTNKSAINIKAVKKQFKKWLSIPFGYRGAELQYTTIKPCIIAEELLKNDELGEAISPKSLIDYKVWCFNGTPESIWVAYDRTPKSVKMALYDTTWKPMSEHLVSSSHYKYCPNTSIPKPGCLPQLLEIAEKLAKPFTQVRVDFYVLNDKPYIGELTFSTGYGYFTKEYYQYLGSKIDITKEHLQ